MGLGYVLIALLQQHRKRRVGCLDPLNCAWADGVYLNEPDVRDQRVALQTRRGHLGEPLAAGAVC